MEIISPEGFQGSYEVMTQVIQALEYNACYQINVLCEPQLGKRGLYPTVSQKGGYGIVEAMTDFIAYADGKNDLVRISDKIGVSVKELRPIIEKLMEAGVISSLSD